MKRLEGKIALITGATSGIGEATALRFAEEGASLALLGRNEGNGKCLEEKIRKLGVQANFYRCDVASLEEIAEVTQAVERDFSRIDILFNGAGIATAGTIEELSFEEWDMSFMVNVRATFAFCKWAVPLMRVNGSGNIINVASTAGTVGANGLHVYSSSKGAVVLLSKSMAADYSRENIRVNCLCPGATMTPMMDGLGEEGLQEFCKLIPAQRMAEAREIANTALFLASDESSFVYGSTLVADGGFTAI